MHYCYHGQLLSTAENTFLTVLLLLETNKLIVKDGFKILKTSQACCTFSFGFFLRRETSFNVKGIYKLWFLFLGMKKKKNSPAFPDKLLVFQQHKTAVRPKEISTYESGRERRFRLALANHLSPRTILPFIHVQQSSSCHSFLVWWVFLVYFSF